MPSVDELWAWMQTPVHELVSYRADNPDKTWEEHRAHFVEQLGLSDPSAHPLVEELVRYLDELPDDERAELLADTSRFEPVVLEVVERHAVDDAPSEGAEPYDEAAWQAFLVENGARWDGADDTWPAFREWFAYYATETGLGQPATALLEYLDPQSAPERVATLAQYGVVIAPAEETPADVAEAPDAAAAEPLQLTDEDMAALLAEDADFADIPEERRRELIAQLVDGT